MLDRPPVATALEIDGAGLAERAFGLRLPPAAMRFDARGEALVATRGGLCSIRLDAQEHSAEARLRLEADLCAASLGHRGLLRGPDGRFGQPVARATGGADRRVLSVRLYPGAARIDGDAARRRFFQSVGAFEDAKRGLPVSGAPPHLWTRRSVLSARAAIAAAARSVEWCDDVARGLGRWVAAGLREAPLRPSYGDVQADNAVADGGAGFALVSSRDVCVAPEGYDAASAIHHEVLARGRCAAETAAATIADALRLRDPFLELLPRLVTLRSLRQAVRAARSGAEVEAFFELALDLRVEAERIAARLAAHG